MGTLVIAAGGGGDAITAAALARPLGLPAPPVVLTYSWDRLMIDPLPGPRTADDFTGLHPLAPHVLEVLPTTQPIPPAGSSLPRLATDLPTRLLLLDPTGGAVGMAAPTSSAHGGSPNSSAPPPSTPSPPSPHSWQHSARTATNHPSTEHTDHHKHTGTQTVHLGDNFLYVVKSSSGSPTRPRCQLIAPMRT